MVIISDVAIALVHSEKTHLKKLMKMIYYYYYLMNKLQETRFLAAPEIDFRHETEARKKMVDFKFDALYR